MEKIAIYAGSFDPITNGHIGIIKRALKVVDKLVIAVGVNADKKPLFSVSDRVDMVKKATTKFNVEVESFNGLIVDYAKRKGCHTLIRSLRAVSDFDYEFQMALINRKLDHKIETIFLMTDEKYLYLSSSLVKDLAKNKCNISTLVPSDVGKKLNSKIK